MKLFLYKIYRYFRPIKILGKNNKIKIEKGKKKNLRITINGNNNTIIIKNNYRLTNLNILISGDNNELILDNNVAFLGDSTINLIGNSTISIGQYTGVRGCIMYAKDANIFIGERCMLSYGITIRNNDMHQIYHTNNNEIINNAKDISINNHVWIAANVTILKGVIIGENSIIGTCAVVTKSCTSNSIIAGNPAMVVKENINWDF